MLGQDMNAVADRYYAPGDTTRKPLIYFAEYERLLGPIRNEPLKIVEFGVASGASMLVWRDYLPNATIIGVDLAPTAPAAVAESPRLHFVSGSQDDPATLAKVRQIAGGALDLVVDDCAHVGRFAKRSFVGLFDAVKPGRSYVIEDICAAFLVEHISAFDDARKFVAPPLVDRKQNIKDFASHTNGLVGFVKQLIDHGQSALASGTTQLPISRVTIITNMAIIERGA